MELRHLKYFVTVAEDLSFSRAAAKLYISQPALSRQIRNLEDELGVLLFLRKSDGLTLTEAGRFFLEQAKDILNRSYVAVQTIKDLYTNTKVKLICADLSHAKLGFARLSQANLSSANLSNANLICADLSHANLSGANLKNASLSGANLEGAYLTGANLKNAKVSDFELSSAFIEGAIMPDGSKYRSQN